MRHLTVAAAGLVLALALTATGSAEDPVEVHLARYAVHEAGWRAPGDYVAIWEVARWRAENPLAERCGGGLVCALRAYAAERPFREPWIGQLGLAGLRPADWPTNASWERRRGDWGRAVELARRWLDEEIRPACRYLPQHWGSRRIAIDVRRAARAVSAGRWRRAECYDPVRRAPTRNAFFCARGRCQRVAPDAG